MFRPVRVLPGWLATIVALAGALVLQAPGASAAPAAPPPFAQYTGTVPLAQLPPGTVLKTRVLARQLGSPAGTTTVVQLLYRSTGQLGQPTVNITSVLLPQRPAASPKLISYQSFYDSLNPRDEPSQAIEDSSLTIGQVPARGEAAVLAFLQHGYTVAIPDTEGQPADFAAGPEYGLNTIDGIRAALHSGRTGLAADTPVGLIGYSGGAIATEWAAELAPRYAPDVNRLLVGAAMGGVLVDPAHNLHYVDGSRIWAGVLPMAVVGVARAFHTDLTPYLNDYGKQVFQRMQHVSIVGVLGWYPGLTWAQLAKPEFATPESVPVYVHLVNQLIMGTGGTPTTPLFIGQGAHGELEGTPGDKPGIGPGDGVMIAGDVRSLARQYCAAGATVQYHQYDQLSHVTAALPWLFEASSWLLQRFSGTPAPQNCAQIAPGNSLAPVPESAAAGER